MCKESLLFSNSVHLGPRTGLPDKILKRDYHRVISAKLESKSVVSEGKTIKCHPPFSIFNSDHVGLLSGLLDTIMKGGHPRTI